MIITDEQRRILIEKNEDFAKLIEADDIYDFLNALDDFILAVGFDDKYDLNEDGLILQRIYDEIYNQNPDEN